MYNLPSKTWQWAHRAAVTVVFCTQYTPTTLLKPFRDRRLLYMPRSGILDAVPVDSMLSKVTYGARSLLPHPITTTHHLLPLRSFLLFVSSCLHTLSPQNKQTNRPAFPPPINTLPHLLPLLFFSLLSHCSAAFPPVHILLISPSLTLYPRSYYRSSHFHAFTLLLSHLLFFPLLFL